LKRTSFLDGQQLALVFDAPAELPPGSSPDLPAGLRPDMPPAVEPKTPPLAGDQRRIALDHQTLDYRLRRARRRTIGFQISDGGLTVSAPRWVGLREIEAAIREKQRWIHTRISAWHDWHRKRRLNEIRFADGGLLPYLGQHLTLRLRADAAGTRVQDAELLIALPATAEEAQIRDAVCGWLQREANRVLGERLVQLSAPLAIKPSGWKLSSARSQWGSCTHDRRIRLNWRLVHFSVPVIDYVVAHELAHLTEMNHSTQFWQRVGELMPGFESARAEIRQVDLASLAF
jgi:predicted metal-dependent hydrolase